MTYHYNSQTAPTLRTSSATPTEPKAPRESHKSNHKPKTKPPRKKA